MRKKALTIRSRIKVIPRDGAKQPAVESAEVLIMMEALARWVCYDHRHKTFLSKELIWIAARLLGLRSMGTHWALERSWPTRAFLMGIDLKTFTVVDPVKFKWFWYQLGESGKFDIKLQQRLLESGKEPPEMEPLLITKPYWTPKIKAQRQFAEEVKENQDTHLREAILEHFFV